jgi:hypothetical protein
MIQCLSTKTGQVHLENICNSLCGDDRCIGKIGHKQVRILVSHGYSIYGRSHIHAS